MVLSVCVQSGFAAKADGGYPRIMQGPMVGAVAPDSLSIWVRLSGPYTAAIEYDVTPEFSHAKTSATQTADKKTDYCLTLSAANLNPDTTYYYRILVEGAKDTYLGNLQPFTTKTAPDGPARFRVAFGSCARWQEDREQPIWQAVRSISPDLFFWLGDNIYGDALDHDILAEEYRRQRDVALLQPLIRSIPQLAVWDDHDFGLNDHDRTHPHKAEALKVFKTYWPNPEYGTPLTPGVFFTYSYGGVDFIFIDIRYYRDPNAGPDGPEKTMLGEGQLKWLKDQLKQSRSPFKVIVSGSGFTKAKGPGGDSWAAFVHERDQLFEYIQHEKISGVVLLTGDTHVGELNCVPWSEKGGYDLYDLVSSPLAQTTGMGWTSRRPERRIRQVYNASPNVGLIEFDLTGDPKLTFNLIDVYGRTVWAPFELSADELVNGKSTWREKMDDASRKRYEQYTNDQPYYEP